MSATPPVRQIAAFEPIIREAIREASEGPEILSLIQHAQRLLAQGGGALLTAYDQRCLDFYSGRITTDQVLDTATLSPPASPVSDSDPSGGREGTG